MSNASTEFSGRWKELTVMFLKLGAFSYGGPAIMGIMQAEVQEKRQWLSKERFLEGLALVNMLPGPGATQLGIFIGYERAGWRGGVLAGLCFMLPAFCILLALTILYSMYGGLAVMRDAFYGLGPVVLGIFIVAVYRLGKTALKERAQIVIAIVCAMAVAFTPLGIATSLLLAACAGVALYHSRVWGWCGGAGVLALSGAIYLAQQHFGSTALASAATATMGDATRPAIWQLAAFFLKAGAFTFGGGITVLAFVQAQVVNQLHWLTAQEFLDGLALGQLTPGPILMLAAYVGYKMAGLTGAVISASAIFLPAFVLMLSVLPVLARFKHVLWIRAAMKGVAPAVIGALSVSLLQIAPHASPDVFTACLMCATVAAMLLWRAAPLPFMLGGAVAGIAARLR